MLFHNNFVTSEFDVYTIHLAKAIDDFRQALRTVGNEVQA